jgi:hypothetical protein
VTSLKESLLFPPTTGNNDYQDLLKKFNLSIKSPNPIIDDFSLITNPIRNEYSKISYPSKVLDKPITDMFSLIPVTVGIRIYNGTYHIQTKTVDRVISKNIYDMLLSDNLTIVNKVSGDNHVLEDTDRFFLEGLHYNLTVRSGLLLNIGITIEEIKALDIDFINYKIIYLSLPEPLYGLPGLLPGSHVVESLETFKSRWLNMSILDLIMNTDINNVKSHIVRKFIMDIKTNKAMLDGDSYDNYDTVKLVLNYLERTWTDELKYKVREEFPTILTTELLTNVEFKRFTILHKLGTYTEPKVFTTNINYYRDKNYIMNVLYEKINR